jgi:hypothetical protein
MKVRITGLVSTPRARTISGHFGSAIAMIDKQGNFCLLNNVNHRLHPVFGWYLCTFRGYERFTWVLNFIGYRKAK